ncbi:MAG: ABC transporter transmembrane domain-containing protein [Candidatus Planktophila sp.]|nr:ABC transporter transmembrane domain-containing protein [Candidatus Planktophila sp.]
MKSSDLRLLLSRSGSRRLFFLSIAAATIWSTVIVLSALVLSSIIVGIIKKSEGISTLLIYLSCIWFFRALFQARFEYWCSLQAVRIKQEIRSEITSSLDAFSNLSSSTLSTLLIKGLNSLDLYLGRFLPQLFFASITPVVVIVTLLILDPLSGVIAILTLPLIPLFGALIGRYTADSVAKKWQTLGLLSQYFEDSLRGFVTLKIFSRLKSQPQRIEEMGDEYTDETMKVLRISFLSALALELCATISVALIAVSIGLRLVDGTIGFTSSLAVLILAPEVYFPLRNAASLFHASADGSEAFAQLTHIQSQRTVSVIEEPHDFSRVSTLEWSDWSLNIPGRIDTLIRGEVLHTGDIFFIVGESGIGKSTFALNLLGVNNQATLVADGVEVTAERRKSWFKSIGWVPQNPQLAHGNVGHQFTIVDEGLSNDEVTQILGLCGLALSDLPEGLATAIGASGEVGSAASGGQIRKIALARAIAAKPRVLIADEPTADLDQASGESVMKTLRDYASNGAIVICITHDQSVLRDGDLVATFSKALIQ